MKTISVSMGIMDEGNITIDQLPAMWHRSQVAAVDMLRLDKLHPIISGNKWYKLQFNLKNAIANGHDALLTFGGGYSNHLAATAYAGMLHQLPTIGVIRGHYPVLTPTLTQCAHWGMVLVYITAKEYAQKDDPGWVLPAVQGYQHIFVVPEGGNNSQGRDGSGLIARLIPAHYTHILVSVGTGTTLAGIRNALPLAQRILGFAPMKQGRYLAEEIATYTHKEEQTNWQLYDDWHFGGFGKATPELIDFMNNFHVTTGIPLDRVYTAKMMFGLQEMLQRGDFKPTDNILCIHTGGLQGNESLRGTLNSVV